MTKILILHAEIPATAPPDDLDTLAEAQAVEDSLRRSGHETVRMALPGDLTQLDRILEDNRPDLVFNLVESVAGSARLAHAVPALLEEKGVPFTGGNAQAMMLASDKVLAKRILSAMGVPTPAWFSATDPQVVDSHLYPPYIVKHMWTHASYGITEDSVFPTEDALRAFLSRPGKRFQGMFVERFIEGREFNVSILGRNGEPHILPPAEMLFVEYPEGKPKVVDYRAKWQPDSFEYRHTVRRFLFPPQDARLLQTLEDLSRQCWNVFGLSGFVRVDFRVEHDGRPWVLEINVNPCIAPDAGFAAAAAQVGIGYDSLIQAIVNEAASGVKERAAR